MDEGGHRAIVTGSVSRGEGFLTNLRQSHTMVRDALGNEGILL